MTTVQARLITVVRRHSRALIPTTFVAVRITRTTIVQDAAGVSLRTTRHADAMFEVRRAA